MKLSVTVADKGALPSAFVVFRGFEASIKKAAQMGYQGVELALKHKNELNPAALRGWLDESGMAVSAISTGQVFADLGLYFTSPDQQIRKEAVSVFKGLVELAASFGGVVNVGRARGFVAPTQSRDEAVALFVDAMSELCAAAEPVGVRFIIEPVNRYETNFLNTVDEAAAVIKRINQPNVGLMPDVFHMNIEEARIGESLKRHADLVHYIHFADSNRLAPGWGHLDFDDIFEALGAIGYDGWGSVEIQPIPDADAAAAQAATYLLGRLT